jgi:hypothetical protein
MCETFPTTGNPASWKASTKSYQGTLQILRFNWPWYASVLALWLLLGLLFQFGGLPAWLKVLAISAVGLASFWAVASLVVSYWVYDRSPLRQWSWIVRCVPLHSIRVANIHAGFDDTSAALRRVLPHADLIIWDIYDPRIMTEPSLLRAQHAHPSAIKAARVNLEQLPELIGQLDAAFLIFAAHEIRSPITRTRFFAELHRTLKPGSTLLLVEHLRDWKNFLAFGPGFFHFLARREWLRLARVSGFHLTDRFTITPFVSVISLTKPNLP